MSAEATLKTLVAAHPFIAGLKPSACEPFYQCASLRRFESGQEILREGGKADHLFLIQSGQVILELSVPGRGRVTVQALGPGEALGWSWLFPPYQWHFSATANQTTQAIAFEAEFLKKQVQQDHEFCYELMLRLAQVLAGRLEDLRTRLIFSYEQKT